MWTASSRTRASGRRRGCDSEPETETDGLDQNTSGTEHQALVMRRLSGKYVSECEIDVILKQSDATSNVE